MAVIISTLQPYYIRGTSGYFKGKLIDMDGNAAIDVYFEYRIKGVDTWTYNTSVAAEELTDVGEFNSAEILLIENNTYEVRAVAEWIDGTTQYAYGSIVEFNAAWVREGSKEDFVVGILNGVESRSNGLTKIRPLINYDLTDFATVYYRTVNNTTIMNVLSSGVGSATILSSSAKESLNSIQTTTGYSNYEHPQCFWFKFTEVLYQITDFCILYGYDDNRPNGNIVSFVIEASANSTNGSDGSWVAGVWNGIKPDRNTGESANKRSISFNLDEIKWVRIGLTGIAYEFSPLIYTIFFYVDTELSGFRKIPYCISNTNMDINWTAIEPIGTTTTIQAQIQSTSTVTDESVGTGDGVETVFMLNYWPANTPTITVNGSPETGFSLGVDLREITFDTAPVDTHAILASYTAVDDSVDYVGEEQELDLDSPSGGTFKLGNGVEWTSDIPYDASLFRILGWVIEEFTSNGTFNVPVGVEEVDVLVVAGGGGAGSKYGGGGGAGGLIFEENFSVTPESAISVTVGTGGSTFSNGGNSVFDTLTAIGGGRGGDRSFGIAYSGGSGGGGAGWLSMYRGDGTSGQGNAGGYGYNPGGDNPGGGGGGASKVGRSAFVAGQGGNGGDGLDFSDIFGTNFGENGWFAGGGGGASRYGTATGTGIGGLGGGGDASVGSGGPGQAGAPNTGGGGAGGSDGQAGGAGGSGIVLVRYRLPTISGLIDIYGIDNVMITENSGIFTIIFDPSVGNSNLEADFTGLT